MLARVGDYYELSKPRIAALLLITTAAAMVMAARGVPPLALLFWTLFAGALAAASAGAFNCAWDADIDRIMKRTQQRPIPQGRISVRNATIYAFATGIISFALFYFFVGPLAAWLSLAGNVYYVVIYTMWLKRMTPLNIVVGGAAGSVPPLVGWAAVTHAIGGPALGLFALIFLWTPPHFWSLSLITETDYDKAKIPMLPNVCGTERTKREIVYYSLLLVASVAGALSAARYGRILLCGSRRSRRHLLARRAAHVARAERDARGAQTLSLLAALSRADVRGHGDRPDRLVNRLLWTLALGVFAGALDLGVLSPALPALGREFSVATGNLAWVFTLYLLVTVLSIALASTAADRYGRRPVYVACLVLFAVGSIVAITAPELRRLLGRTRDSGAGSRRHLSGRHRDDRRRRAGRAARSGARSRRRHVGVGRGYRAAVRRPDHALHLVAMDLRRQRSARSDRFGDGARRRSRASAAPPARRSTFWGWRCSASDSWASWTV